MYLQNKNKNKNSSYPVYENDQAFPNFYGVQTNTLFNTPYLKTPRSACAVNSTYASVYPRSFGNTVRETPAKAHAYRWSSNDAYATPETVFTNTQLECGPIQDPYCPTGMGVVGGVDTYGFPLCICPASGRQYTNAVLDVHSPAQRVSEYPVGPFLTPPCNTRRRN